MAARIIHVYFLVDKQVKQIGVNMLIIAHFVHDSQCAGKRHFCLAIRPVGSGNPLKTVGQSQYPRRN